MDKVKTIRPSAPCKDCPVREPGCHSCCEKYIEFREDLDLYNALLRDISDEQSRVIGYEAKKKEKLRKKYG